MENETGIEHLVNGITDDSGDEQFNSSYIKNLDWSLHNASFRGEVSPSHPGDHLLMRPLSVFDFEHGFVQLLSQLTDVGDLTREKFIERFRMMRSCPGTYFTVVIEDTRTGQLVGTATLVVEQKFIHAAAIRGRVEDVVVSELCRGQQLGKLLVETLLVLGRQLGCYKISLGCKVENIKFYETLGFTLDEQQYMLQRFQQT